MAQTENWHADKRVPIALIFAIAVQTAAVVWWASDISSQVNIISEAQRDDRARISQNSAEVAALARSSAVADQRLGSIEDSIRRTENNVSEILRYLRNQQK